MGRIFAILLKTKAVTFAAFVFIVAVSITRATFFPEADVFWGARNGIDTLQHGIHIFQPDTWNLLTLGEQWSPNSWLWNVFLGGAYQLFGNYGFLLLTAVTNIATYCFLWAYLQKLKIAPLAAFLMLIGCWFVMNLFMNGRSNTADLLILMAFLYLSRHLLDKYISLLISSFLLTVLWMNLHMTGVAAALIFPAVVFALLYRETLRGKLLKASGVLLVTLAALPVTPYGFDGLIKLSMVKNESKGLMVEWSNVFFLPGANSGILLLLAVSVILCVFMFRKKQWLYGLLTVALIYGTYDTIRLTPFLLTIALAALVFWEDKYSQPLVPHPRMNGIPELMTGLLLVGTLIVSTVGITSLERVIGDSESMFPVTSKELSLIPENARVAASQDAGSVIILFRPDALVTLDGRNDLIGMERFVEASNIRYSDNPTELSAWLEKHDIDTVFVEDKYALGADVIAENMKELGWEVRNNETKAISYVRDIK